MAHVTGDRKLDLTSLCSLRLLLFWFSFYGQSESWLYQSLHGLSSFLSDATSRHVGRMFNWRGIPSFGAQLIWRLRHVPIGRDSSCSFQTIEELKSNKLQQSTTVLLLYAAWVAVTAPTSKRSLTHHQHIQQQTRVQHCSNSHKIWAKDDENQQEFWCSWSYLWTRPNFRGRCHLRSRMQMNTPTIPSTTQVHNSIQHYAEHQKQRFGSW